MRSFKKTLSCLLAIMMLAGIFCAAPFSASATATVFNVGTAQALESAIDTINSSSDGVFEIYLTADINNADKKYSFERNTTTIYGNNHTITFTNQVQGFTVGEIANTSYPAVTLNLGSADYKKSLTLKSSGTLKGDEPGALYIWGANSTINMYSGVTVDGFVGNNYYGGGVSIEAGKFNMYGGTIKNCGIDGGSNCFGGGVGVINGGQFVMNGGVIEDCSVKSDGQYFLYPYVAGGGVAVLGASFEFNGGIIRNCRAFNTYVTNNTTDAQGGGVAVITTLESYYENGRNWGFLDSNFTMTGGTIEGCYAARGGGAITAGLYYVDIYQMLSDLVAIEDNPNPHGIYISGGTLRNNESYYGGAAFLSLIQPSIPVQIKNVTIDNNTAKQGGGIIVYKEMTCAEIEDCIITNNKATASNGGGIAMIGNTYGETYLTDTLIENNTSAARGGGVYYDDSSALYISGKNIIKGNTYNGKKNNLNILSDSKPVYVDGDLTGSQIGLSDPTLWDDDMEDTDANAVSTIYLTSDYKANNASLDPLGAFFSDHESWYPGFSDVNENEVRLVRKTYDVNYHINNADKDDIYADEIFTPYVTNHVVQAGNDIEEFHNIPQLKDPDGYVFKGWYYDRDNNDDSHPIVFGETYDSEDIHKGYHKNIDIYAHWEKVDKIEQEYDNDFKDLPSDMQGVDGKFYYDSFGLFGVQLRPGNYGKKDSKGNWYDENTGEKENGGLRFATSIGEQLLSDIDDLSNETVNGHKVEYGFVTAPKSTIETVCENFNINKATYKLQYKGSDVNGVDTLLENATREERITPNNFRYVTNVDCTSQWENPNTHKVYGGNDAIQIDHRDCDAYRIATFVVTYKDHPEDMDKDIVARAYIRYYDANGLLRTFYNDYGGTTVYGGCCTNYVEASKLLPKEPIDYNNQITK